MKVRVSTACPSCRARHVIDLEEIFEVKPPGMYTVAGPGKKAGVREAWRYRCTECGTSGKAEPPDLPLTELMGRPIGACGHTALTDHSAGTGHDLSVCPGCCHVCQAVKDANRTAG